MFTLLEITKWAALFLALLLLYLLWQNQAERWSQIQQDARETGGSEQGAGQKDPTRQRNDGSEEEYRRQNEEESRRRREEEAKKKQNLLKKLLKDNPDLVKEILDQLGIDVPVDQLEEDPELLKKIASSIDQTILDMMEVATRKAAIDLDLKSGKRLKEQTGGEAHRQLRRMRGSQEISRIRPSELAKPRVVRNYRIATNQAEVMQGYTMVQEQKVLVVLEDVSGSMFQNLMADGNLRYVWSRGVIINLARQAIAGKSWFYYRPFSEQPGMVVKITNKDEAKSFLGYLINNRSVGGGTNIFNAFTAAIGDIKSGKGDIAKADILIVSDGEDESMSATEDIKKMLGDKTRLHVIIIGGGVNKALKKVAHSYQEFR